MQSISKQLTVSVDARRDHAIGISMQSVCNQHAISLHSDAISRHHLKTLDGTTKPRVSKTSHPRQIKSTTTAS